MLMIIMTHALDPPLQIKVYGDGKLCHITLGHFSDETDVCDIAAVVTLTVCPWRYVDVRRGYNSVCRSERSERRLPVTVMPVANKEKFEKCKS